MYQSLGEFISFLEKKSKLVRVKEEISADLELTEVQKHLIKRGPAVIFENIERSNMAQYRYREYESMPVISNLFGTEERVAMGLGLNSASDLRAFGEELALLKHPKMPDNFSQAKEMFPLVKRVISMRPKVISKGPCQERIFQGKDVDIGMLPIQSCWPGEPAPLITWSVCVTRGKDENNYNLGIYRMQVLGPNKVIVRWLKHRGGAEHYRSWQGNRKMPISVVIGADPATLLAAVMPIPENISEYNFSGLIRKKRLALVKCKTNDILVPAGAEIILEGYINLDEMADEGPYGDHTGFYNDIEKFPVMTITAITMRENPIYLTTFTGRPPDEPSVLGEALNEVFVPMLQKQFPEITDFWLPPEACSYRIAVVSIKKSYPGHGRRVMMGIWSYLKQFAYTKFIIVVDNDIDVRNWQDVMWAVSTQMDFNRDVFHCSNTPIDYLDFASEQLELGAKIGFDATKKIYPETKNVWGRKIISDEVIIAKIGCKLRDSLISKFFNES
jgi:4-hydroxy-3-polyprenylbenzoate decarboxylase